eukprot:TRINITY_DN1566_c0_g2_i1.p1 TRINITY_DN1566_c0_g2~~TRINITY_DN1566_c0_g2_i1.p1  ORF type:complete len:196 (-),score=11.92 TRINITY_DN1566_c0_g2_i1:113-700(-)
MLAQSWFGLLLILSLYGRGYRLRDESNNRVGSKLTSSKCLGNGENRIGSKHYRCCYVHYDNITHYGKFTSVECSSYCNRQDKKDQLLYYDVASHRIASKDRSLCVGYDAEHPVQSRGEPGPHWLQTLNVDSGKCIDFDVICDDYGNNNFKASNFTKFKYFNIPWYSTTMQSKYGKETKGFAILWSDDGYNFYFDK